MPRVEAMNVLEPEMQKLSDEQLRAKTDEFRRRVQERLSAIPDEPDADPDRIKQLEEERTKVLNEALDEILVEAFAVVREAGRRVLNMRHFDVQLIGGIVLHEGKISEMKTGEGKTLVATLPVYLNALSGRGVHVVTVNDYLAKRDAEWMGKLYKFLGLSVGVIVHDLDDDERRQSYAADVTYGTNNEFGFDYLRDNMKFDFKDCVQRGHHYAIVDEVDSILIDEARTPLIISGPVESSQQKTYIAMRPFAERLREAQSRFITQCLREAVSKIESNGDYPDEALEKLLLVKRGDPKNRQYLDLLVKHRDIKKKIDQLEGVLMSNKQLSDFDNELYCYIDEKSHNVEITEKGREFLAGGKIEEFIIPDPEDPNYTEDRYIEVTERIHTIQQLVKAYWLFEKDVYYVINDNKVVIVDEFTGRLMPGRRWSDGLHEAIEAKERVKIERENQTLATITFQNYFRMYKKLAGMTGTADTEAVEFDKISNREVAIAPTTRPLIRGEFPDVVYRTEREKFDAVVEEIEDLHTKGQPVLVGTISIEKSEHLSELLKKRRIPHVVLNAKYHEKEAEIVAQAGRLKAVTIATNMAGRGTDILLGGNPEFLARREIAEQGVDPSTVTPEQWKERMERHQARCVTEHDQVVGLGGLPNFRPQPHEARRIDNQLRGRAGRQGDPGSSRFYMSLEDDLMRIFGSDRISGLMKRLRIEEGVPIEHRMVTRAIERAQKQVEARNFEIRKHLLEYDDVNNKQRTEIYRLRRELLEGKGQKEYRSEEHTSELQSPCNLVCRLLLEKKKTRT